MRKHYIDNLRTFSVLFLFLFHTCMIYNAFGENFYIRGPKVRLLNDIILVSSPWYMPLLFVMAGISSSFALKRRTVKQYSKERFFKLFIPLVFGILIYIPVQTFYAEKFHNQYTGGFFNQYILFFTKTTDLTGYTGGFTPAHLWFILYLFIISMIALPIMLYYNKSTRQIDGNKLSIPKILPLFLIPLSMEWILDIGGKSLGEFFALFLLGYFVLSKDEIINRLEASRWWLFTTSLILLAFRLYLFYNVRDFGTLFDIYSSFIMWICILATLGMGKHFLNFSNPVTDYLSKGSFPIYFFHQTWVIAVAFYVFKITSVTALQIPLIIILSVSFTFINYEIFRRIPVTRFMFGIKK